MDRCHSDGLFKLITSVIQKNEYVFGKRLSLHLLSSDGSETVEAFVDVHRCSVKEVSAFCMECYHLDADNNSLRNDADTG